MKIECRLKKNPPSLSSLPFDILSVVASHLSTLRNVFRMEEATITRLPDSVLLAAMEEEYGKGFWKTATERRVVLHPREEFRKEAIRMERFQTELEREGGKRRRSYPSGARMASAAAIGRPRNARTHLSWTVPCARKATSVGAVRIDNSMLVASNAHGKHT